jgi:transposase
MQIAGNTLKDRAVDVTTGSLSKPFFGLRARARRGRDLPEGFGKWFTVYTRFWRWAQKGVWERVFKALRDDPDFEYVLIDGTLRSISMAPAQKGDSESGRSRGGLTTKIMALVDALGNLIRFVLLPGQRHDSIGVEPLITGLDFEALIGDKAFDNNWLRANLNERGAAAVIPSKADRAGRNPHDAEMYKWRHLIENFFCSLKAFRRIATRYEKTDACFAGVLNLVASFLASR